MEWEGPEALEENPKGAHPALEQPAKSPPPPDIEEVAEDVEKAKEEPEEPEEESSDEDSEDEYVAETRKAKGKVSITLLYLAGKKSEWLYAATCPTTVPHDGLRFRLRR